uniref:Uncharacterized protein n=1 Tax=Ciona savignyi TaxID=51511 RepID=H2YLR7_CIOSA
MDVTKQFLEGISCALRQVLDNEALTGRTGFYDSIDQVLHDNDIDGISSLQKYYKTDIISYYMALKSKSKMLQNQLKSSKSKPNKGDQGNCEARENQSAINIPIKDETQTQSGWVPVHNTSGESVSTVIASTNPRWMPFVKIEPFNQSQLDNPITSFQPISSPTNTETSRPVRKKMRK